MAKNFAKEQLMKYGWTEGKGLGKDENGITEPVKLASNQNKKGIGYDENEPWWEGLFNNATKNVKVETHGDLVSLNVVKNAGAIPPRNELGSLEKTVLQYNYKKFLGIESRLAKANAHLTDQKPDTYGDETAYETTKDSSKISGKLERLAEQDRIFLSVKPPLNATPSIMAYRKRNVESDVEGEEEHKTDNDANASQSGEETSGTFFRSKTAMKRHRRKINKLVEQLGTCNLEEKQNLPNKEKKLSQKMKKNKEESKNILNSNVLNYLRSETKKNYLYTQLIPMCNEVCTKEYRVRRLQLLLDKADRDTKSLLDQAFKALSDSVPELAGCEYDKDSIELKVESISELENGVEGNGTTDERLKDWVFMGIEDHIQAVVKDSICEKLEQQNLSIVPHTKSYLYNISSFGPDPIEERCQNFRRLNKVRKKESFQCCPSKNRRRKRVTKSLKGEALSQEMNSVIKNLMAVGLSEEVNANIIKKRPTQTHLTPV